MFTSATGLPLRHNLFYARHYKPAVLRAGLPPALRFHDLRYTCAALLVAEGAHPKVIMERLGHSSIQVTLDRYGHLFPGLDERLTDARMRPTAPPGLTTAVRALSCGTAAEDQLRETAVRFGFASVELRNSPKCSVQFVRP